MWTTSAHLKILQSKGLWYGIWQYVGNLTLFCFICAALCGLSFFCCCCHYLALNVCWLKHNTVYLHNLHSTPPIHLIKHKYYISGFSYVAVRPERDQVFIITMTPQQPFHWSVSILWLSMCKPVKSANKTGCFNKNLLSWASTACGWKLLNYKKQVWWKIKKRKKKRKKKTL